MSEQDKKCDAKKDYDFGGIKEYSLEQIEKEVLNESVYLDVFAGSDVRLKKDIKPIKNSLAKVCKLNGVTWAWRAEEFPTRPLDAQSKIGFLAQNVQEFFPEIVKGDKEGMLAIDYSKMTAVLVEAVKELSDRVAKLEAENAKLRLS